MKQVEFWFRFTYKGFPTSCLPNDPEPPLDGCISNQPSNKFGFTWSKRMPYGIWNFKNHSWEWKLIISTGSWKQSPLGFLLKHYLLLESVGTCPRCWSNTKSELRIGLEKERPSTYCNGWCSFTNLDNFSIYASHPCSRAMLIFFAMFQFYCFLFIVCLAC